MMWNKTLFFFICLGWLGAMGQERDAGLWTSLNLNSEVAKDFEISISPELRLNENLKEVASYFADISGQYKLNKYLSFSAGYRAGRRNSGDFYEGRQRVQLGLNVKKKVKDFSLSWSPKWQSAIGASGAENDGDFITTMRNKFKILYGGFKKYELSTSFEIFNVTSSYSPPLLQNWRWVSGLERDLKKGQSVGIGYQIQRDLTESPKEMDYIFLINYSFRLDIYKKKSDKKKDEEKKEP